jgi:uncharacterized lipoprotein YmbA
MREEAKELARAMLDAKETSYSIRVRITDSDGGSTGDAIAVVALRVSEDEAREFVTLSERYKAAAHSTGQVCPKCGGSGRVP